MKIHDYTKSQNAQVIMWLNDHPERKLTWLMAYNLFGTTKLATRVSDLTTKGGFLVTKLPSKKGHFTDYMVTYQEASYNKKNFPEFIKRVYSK